MNVTDPAQRATVADLVRARAASDALRGEWIADLRTGASSVFDLLRYLDAEPDSPLRHIRLTTATAAHLEGTGRAGVKARAKRVVARTLRVAEASPDTKPTIGWVLDGRSGRRRLHSYVDALGDEQSSTRAAPWPGFPLSPAPRGDDPHG